MQYNEIYELFEPIFQWLKEQYPNDGFFIVERNGARFCGDKHLLILPKENIDRWNELMASIRPEDKEKSEQCFNEIGEVYKKYFPEQFARENKDKKDDKNS